MLRAPSNYRTGPTASCQRSWQHSPRLRALVHTAEVRRLCGRVTWFPRTTSHGASPQAPLPAPRVVLHPLGDPEGKHLGHVLGQREHGPPDVEDVQVGRDGVGPVALVHQPAGTRIKVPMRKHARSAEGANKPAAVAKRKLAGEISNAL